MKASIISCGMFIAAIVASLQGDASATIWLASGWIVLALDGNRPNPPRNA